MATLPLGLVNSPTVSKTVEPRDFTVVRHEVEIPLSITAVEKIPFSLVNIRPRLTTELLFASSVLKACDSIGIRDTGIRLMILPWFVAASAKPVMVEPAEFVVVTGLTVPKSSVIGAL